MRPLEPGYRTIEFRPEIPRAGIDHVAVTFNSVRGDVTSSWRKSASGVEIDVVVPPNAAGVVYVPAPATATVTSATSRALGKCDGDRVVYDVGPGRHQFRVQR
jgi:alpha-L-rhamnosidase